MIYRYRLKECRENEGFNSRQFEGVTLYKKRWLYKEDPLILDSYLNLIEFEKASSEEEFKQREVQKRKAKQDEIRERGEEHIKKNPKKREVAEPEPFVGEVIESEETTIEQKEGDIRKMKKRELFDLAKKKGFLESEIFDLKKSDLVSLLELEQEVE